MDEGLLAVRAQLCERIDGIMVKVPTLDRAELVAQIDAVRKTANEYGLAPLEAVTRGLESALGNAIGRTTILPYLDMMRDATACDPRDTRAAQTYLAAVNRRVYG